MGDLEHIYKDAVTRITMGGLIDSIQTDFSEKKFKFKVYSAHDTQLVGIMAAFGQYNFKVPYYASAFVFERYDSGIIKWKFRNDTNHEMYELKLCEDKFELGCNLAEWKYETEELISKDWRAECGISGVSYNSFLVSVLIVSWIIFGRRTIFAMIAVFRPNNGYRRV